MLKVSKKEFIKQVILACRFGSYFPFDGWIDGEHWKMVWLGKRLISCEFCGTEATDGVITNYGGTEFDTQAEVREFLNREINKKDVPL